MATLTTTTPSATTRSTWLPEPGDVILYAAKPGDWLDATICAATHGPYPHTGVIEQVDVADDGDGGVQLTTIEALSGGVSRQTFAYAPGGFHRAYTIAHIAPGLETARLQWALGWLARQLRDPYSALDIAADAIKALLPPALGSRTPFLVAPSAFDCSALVATWLLIAGFEWLPDAALAALARVSPNDIARMVGVLGVVKP